MDGGGGVAEGERRADDVRTPGAFQQLSAAGEPAKVMWREFGNEMNQVPKPNLGSDGAKAAGLNQALRICHARIYPTAFTGSSLARPTEPSAWQPCDLQSEIWPPPARDAAKAPLPDAPPAINNSPSSSHSPIHGPEGVEALRHPPSRQTGRQAPLQYIL